MHDGASEERLTFLQSAIVSNPSTVEDAETMHSMHDGASEDSLAVGARSLKVMQHFNGEEQVSI